MKLILASLLLFSVSSISHASLFSCEDVAKNAVLSETRNRGLNDVVSDITELEQNFSELRLFSVRTNRPEIIGLPYSATWLVILRDESTSSGCLPLQVFHDLTAW